MDYLYLYAACAIDLSQFPYSSTELRQKYLNKEEKGMRNQGLTLRGK